jgi:hypothetical protein
MGRWHLVYAYLPRLRFCYRIHDEVIQFSLLHNEFETQLFSYSGNYRSRLIWVPLEIEVVAAGQSRFIKDLNVQNKLRDSSEPPDGNTYGFELSFLSPLTSILLPWSLAVDPPSSALRRRRFSTISSRVLRIAR